MAKDNLSSLIGKFVVALIVGAALSALFALTTEWMVNHLFTAQFLTLVFGNPKILFWQAFWINVLLGFGTRASK
jgi:hypothetical protein